MNAIKKMILNNEKIAPIAISIRNLPREFRLYSNTSKMLNSYTLLSSPKIYYLGAARHANLGDLAQSVCIRRWFKKHYDMDVVEVETNAIVNTRFSVLDKLVEMITSDDIIVFQSGYTTTDLGGFADEMHRVIMNKFPNNAMLMLPQTIFFKDKKNEERTSKCYNRIKKMLYLARDKVSYQKAKTMFPDIRVELFPDIVTTMIGTMTFDYERNGILFCCRNDGEKYYSEEEVNYLIKKCREFSKVDITDTTKSENSKDVVNNSEEYILKEIEKYAHYKLIVTDRYHGTILSLVASTPVVIIKTNDHKVVTGADWFNGVYDDYVYLSNDLDEAYKYIVELYSKEFDSKLEPYFEKNYYDDLPAMFESVRGE